MSLFVVHSSEIVKLEFEVEADSEDAAITKCLEKGPGVEVYRHSWQVDNVTKEN